jgi:hypothetical protein
MQNSFTWSATLVMSSHRRSKMRFGADDPVIAALEWHVALGCWLLAERIVSADRRIECRYEDLCTAPQETMIRLAKFVNHSEAEALKALEDHASAGATQKTGFETVAAAQHHTRLIEPVDASRIGRYKIELSPEQIQKIEAIAQYGMLAYGYEPSGWHDHPFVWEDRMSLLKVDVSRYRKAMLKTPSRKVTVAKSRLTHEHCHSGRPLDRQHKIGDESLSDNSFEEAHELGNGASHGTRN